VRDNLTQRALKFNIVLDDVSITHVAFSPEFTHAVEAKQVCYNNIIICYFVSLLCFWGRSTNSSACSIFSRSSYPGKTGIHSVWHRWYLSCWLDLFAQSIIIRASGEAKSAELIGEAMRTNKGFLELRRLEAARDIANLLATSGNRVMLDSQSLLLNGACLWRVLWDEKLI
jgi:prohibitin 2